LKFDLQIEIGLAVFEMDTMSSNQNGSAVSIASAKIRALSEKFNQRKLFRC